MASLLKQAKPCPKCGSKRITWDGWKNSWNLCCLDCQYGTLVVETKETALHLWNESLLRK